MEKVYVDNYTIGLINRMNRLNEIQSSSGPAPELYPQVNRGLEEKIKSEDNDKIIIPYKN